MATREMGQDEMQGMMREMMENLFTNMMPEMMLKGMMPHCIEMMMPAVDKGRRAELVLGMIGKLVEQGASGMSEDEKANLVAKVIERVQSTG